MGENDPAMTLPETDIDQAALRRRSQLLQGIADATHLLISYDVREREVLASIEILRQAAYADRVCLEVTKRAPLGAGTPLIQRCVGVDRWTSSFQLPMRWRAILSAHMAIHQSVGDLPPEEASVLSGDRVQVVLSVPIVADKVPRGHLRFDRMTASEGWTPDEVVALQTAANGYGSALAHVEALAALRESEARYRRLVENAPDFIYRMSLPDGTYEYASPAVSDITGYAAAEFLERPSLIREIVHPGWRGYVETEWARLLRGEAPPAYEYAIIHGKTGETRWLLQRNVIIHDDGGDVVAIEGIVCDITARKRAELQLRTQQSMLESIFRAAPVGIGLVSDRYFLQVNDRVCKMTGYTREELVGKSVRKLYPTEADFEYVGSAGYDELRRSGTSVIETRWQRKDGTIVDVLLSSTPLDQNDLAAGITVIALDTTGRDEARTRMQQYLEEREVRAQQMQHRTEDNATPPTPAENGSCCRGSG
ncbi:MAG: PAS domain S-box protein [Anaerolineae bacterium]|nr:PAS domain S-box protein [Anaerolineae bacterium]